MSSAILPPLFQIFTGLSFATLLVIRFAAGGVLKPLWGKVVAFALLLIALGNFLMSVATTRSLSSGAELFAFAGASFLGAAILITAGLFLAARSVGGAETK